MKIDLLKIGLDPLIQFEAIARLKSLKAAAKELGLSQPAVTQALGKLEGNIGVQLCERSRASFSLTEPGRKLHAICEKFKEDLLGFEGFLSTDSEFDGLLSIGVIDNFHNKYFEVALQKTIKKFPQMKLSIQVHAAQEIQDLVASGEIEVGFGIFNRKLNQLTYRFVGHETIQHFISEKHDLWNKRDLKDEDIQPCSKTWVDIINRDRPALDNEIFSGAKKQRAKIRSYANNLNAAVTLLQTGVSIVPIPVEYLESRNLGFKYRSLKSQFPEYRVKQEMAIKKEFLNASLAAKYFVEQLPKV